MPTYDVSLYNMYLAGGYDLVISYYEFVERLNTNRLPVTSDTDVQPSSNTGNSLTASQRSST